MDQQRLYFKCPNLAYLKKKVKSSLCKAVRNFKRFHPEECQLLFCDSRGGSTWLAEAISTQSKTAVLWEPIMTDLEAFKPLGIPRPRRQFIPEDQSWWEAKNAFDALLSGKCLTNATCLYSSPLDFLTAEQMIVKFCAGTGMLPWLTKQYNFKYKPIHLVRHPFAVVASQLKNKTMGSLGERSVGFSVPDCFFSEIYQEHEDFLKTLVYKEEVLCATWCLTNNFCLKNPRAGRDWITVFYEDIVLNPKAELSRVFSQWGLPVPDAAYEGITRPSITAKQDCSTINQETQLNKWKKFYNKEQLNSMTRILNYFSVEAYNPDFSLASRHCGKEITLQL